MTHASFGTESVVYVSFGSLAALGEEQMEELAWGLKRSNSYFLWVVRESEEKKLPSNFIEETSDKGLVVTWSPQLQVLAHKSVGCFMTHWVRVKVNEKGIMTNEEIGNCIREIMERERGKEIRRNSDKWKEFAKEAVDNGGSSDKNIEEFVKKLSCS
ncbi:hypothetical protein EZV62_001577 [Acer yangbiense]|uniref:UDP-glycosyltransferases domain-containing protein n=1 Tax=Acer yangbiense TaxID=1000413 RepID=A0A5C7IV92_9ROSI|nr:hypothetical protein EZV62_001577 [Acer yangbiense]